jgi:hypothetical protein
VVAGRTTTADLQLSLAPTTIPPSSTTDTFPTYGLVAYYPMSGNANDGSGNGNHGTVHGAVLTLDRFENENSAYYFNGQGSFIEIPNAPMLNPSNLTISAWVMLDTTSKPMDIVSKDGEGYDRQYLLNFGSDDTGHFRVHIGRADGTLYWHKSTISPSVGHWYHLVQTWDGNSLKLYVNGEHDNPRFPRPSSGGVTVSSQPVRIGGGAPKRYSPYWFAGTIDDVCIYNRVLSESEIQALYKQGSWPGE